MFSKRAESAGFCTAGILPIGSAGTGRKQVPLRAREFVVDLVAPGETAGRPAQKLPPTAICCHFATARPLPPIQPFQTTKDLLALRRTTWVQWLTSVKRSAWPEHTCAKTVEARASGLPTTGRNESTSRGGAALPGSRRRAAVESIPPIHPYRSCLDATKIRTITAEVPVRRITSHNAISGSRR